MLLAMSLKVALIGGPMYDPLYGRLNTFSTIHQANVRIDFFGTHPSLNEHLAPMADPPYDLVSTHSKYAPSQMYFLTPLVGVIGEEEITDFTESAMALARIKGSVYGLPRNIDVRLLHNRTELTMVPPATCDEALKCARQVNQPPELYGFVFPEEIRGFSAPSLSFRRWPGRGCFRPAWFPRFSMQVAAGRSNC